MFCSSLILIVIDILACMIFLKNAQKDERSFSIHLHLKIGIHKFHVCVCELLKKTETMSRTFKKKKHVNFFLPFLEIIKGLIFIPFFIPNYCTYFCSQ